MRKELVERLRWHAKSMCNGDMYREAADMLEADAPAALPGRRVFADELVASGGRQRARPVMPNAELSR